MMKMMKTTIFALAAWVVTFAVILLPRPAQADEVVPVPEVVPATIIELDPVFGPTLEPMLLGPFERVKIEFDSHDFIPIVVATPLGGTSDSEVVRYLGEGRWTFTGAPENYSSVTLIFRPTLQTIPARAVQKKRRP